MKLNKNAWLLLLAIVAIACGQATKEEQLISGKSTSEEF